MIKDDGTPRLDELRRELEALGMVVVPFHDEIHVRRSTLEYIKVRVDGGILRCEPYVGMMSGARTTWLLMAIEALVIPPLLFRFGASPLGLMAAFTGLIGFGFHALRYAIAEIAVSRIQSVWLELRARHGVGGESAPTPLPWPTTPELPAAEASVRDKSRASHVRVPD